VAGWLHTEIDVRHRELNPTRSPIPVPLLRNACISVTSERGHGDVSHGHNY